MWSLHDSEKDDEDGEDGEDDNDGGEEDLQLGEAGRPKHQHGGLASEVPVHVSVCITQQPPLQIKLP